MLDGPEAKKLTDRLFPPDDVYADYAVLPDGTRDAANRFALDVLAGEDPAKRQAALRGCGLFRWGESVGPFSRDELAEALDRMIGLRLMTLYDGAPPTGAATESFVRLMKVNADGDYHVMVERRQAGPRVWVAAEGAADAQYAQFARGRWTVVRNQRVPRFLKERTPLLVLVAFGPLIVLSYALTWVVWPLVWPIARWEARQKRRELDRARAAIAGQTVLDKSVP